MTDETYRTFLSICRSAGWKCTAQRLAVYDFLHGNGNHPDVDNVWRAVRKTLPSMTRESAYRILNELSKKSVIARIDHIESARYDSRTTPHGHFICAKCGTISDFDLADGGVFPRLEVPGRIHHLEFRAVGVCEKCLKPEKETRNSEKNRNSIKHKGD